MRNVLIAVIITVCSVPCFSQVPASAVPSSEAASIIVGAAPNANLLRAGTEIRLRTLTELGSKTSRVSERFNLEVAEDVRLNGQIVIPVGTRAVGEISKVTKKGMFGKSGKVETRLQFLRIGDQQIRISGSVGDRGKGGAAATVGGTLVFLPAGFFITGTSAVLPPGTEAVGFLESDLPIVFAAPAPVAPLIVPSAVAVPAVAVAPAASTAVAVPAAAVAPAAPAAGVVPAAPVTGVVPAVAAVDKAAPPQ